MSDFEEQVIKIVVDHLGIDESKVKLIHSKAMLKLKTQFTPASLKL